LPEDCESIPSKILENLKEIAYFAPNVPGNKGGAIQMNDLIVGKDDLIYANDRITGGLFILKYTGKTPLN
jgi:hypothetical protein